MTLPAALREARSGRPRPPVDVSHPASAPASETVRPRSILLVDEDPAVQRTIRALFSQDDQTVEAPRDAGDAVRRLEQRSFDLIIADARAAVSAGETFADVLLRRWPELKGRTILVTADVRSETDEWLRQLGCSYFRKPFRVSDLKAAAARITAGTAL